MKTSKNQQGMTLVEMLLVLAILGVLMLGFASFTKFSYSAYDTTSTSVKEIQQIRLTMDRIADDLRTAKKAVPSASGDSLTYQCYADTSDNVLQIGADGRLYLGARAVTQGKVESLTCSYNSSDPSNKTIDITVNVSDQVSLTSTIRRLN